MKIKVAKYISEFFTSHDVTDCFMVTGGGAMHLDDALGHQEGMKCTFNHHEQACAIAAEGYTRMTGKIALVCVTSGPGGTNAITGVMGGWVDSIPMFIISGQVKRETTTWSCQELGLRQLGDQEFQIIDSVKNMTKYAVMITEPSEIAFHLEKAWYLALEGRGGPVWLDIPLDVQGAMVETEEMIHFDVEYEKNNQRNDLRYDSSCYSEPKMKYPCDNTVIRKIVERIRSAKAPLILSGTGIRLGNAEEEFLSFVEKYKIPVVTAWNANDTIAYDNPYYVGMPGTVGIRSGNFAIQNCDLLISLGCRMNIRMIGYNHFDFAKNAYKVVVDIDERELRKPTVKIDLPVCSDVKRFLNKMLDEKYTPLVEHETWRAWCRNLLERFPANRPEFHSSENAMLNPYSFIDSLFLKLREDDRIICGNGSACVVTFQAAKIKQGQRLFTNSGCAAMGYGFPAALGVAVSDNSKRTICIDGDGSIMMNLQELATVKQNNLNLKIFILNNNGYLSIRQTQRNLFQPPYIGIDGESGVSFPDFELVAKAFGLDYYRLEQGESYDRTLTHALGGTKACICEVMLDPEQNFEPKSSSRILPDGRIVSPSLDDMAPFLPREEYEAIRYNDQ
ncbi:MAG: thiamine pyrophosphate-binding protein [Eubacterium sp.]|nr:thiamine pyrophosphate-binding protein [Eubacterium sp.]